MSEYHKKLKQEIRQMKLQTIALRRIRIQMEEDIKESDRIIEEFK
jgi:hypothetical protein